MKKPTSKSASAIPEASSRSGTSAKTVVTEKQSLSSLADTQFGYLLVNAKKRTPDEARQAMIRAGIVTESGELAEHYKQKPKRSRKSRT